MTDLTQSQLEAYDRLYGDNPQPEQESTKPGVFTDWYKFASGVPGGATGGVLSLASSATDTEVNPEDGLFGFNDIINPLIHPTIEQMRQSAADYYRPDPQTTGWVGSTLYGATDVVTRAAIGNVAAPGAGLAFAAGTTGFERTKELQAQGVDENTAALSGAIQGGSLLAAGGLSSIGTSQASRILSGAGLNIAFGSGSRALDSSVLRANGYEAQAAQQEWNDASAMIADGIIGAAFHVLPHATDVPKPRADEVDAALTAKNNQHVADAAPGVPADPISASAHVDALDLAHDQFTDGQAVDVAPVVRDATFVPRPEPVPRSMADVGTVIDNRLSALDELSSGVRSKGDLRDLGKEAGDLEDLLREQYAARDANVTQAPGNQLSPDELSFAENRLADIRSQFEQHRQAIAAKNEAARLRAKLDKTDTDQELRNVAESIAPGSTNADGTPTLGGAIESALRDDGVTQDQIEPPKSNAQITEDFQAKLADHPAAVAEYSQLPDSMGGRVLNTDVARELSSDYLANRTRSAPVHEPASEFVKKLYAEKLAEPTPEGLDNTVMFTAGGTGAGKTTGLDAAIAHTGTNPEIVYDTNMNTPASAEQKIQQALDAGRNVHIVYVYRDPVEALVNGALPRAERQAAKFGTGRTVPLNEHARTHLGVRGVMDALAAKYKGDGRVRIDGYDNSRGKHDGRITALEDLPRINENGLHERLQAALDQEHRAGRISDQTRAGFRAAGRASPDAAVRGNLESQGDAGARGRSGDAAARGTGQQDAGGMGADAATGNPQARPRIADVNSLGPDQTAAAGEAAANRRAGEARGENAGRDAAAQPGAGLDPARAADVERARAVAEQSPDVTLDDGAKAGEAMRAADDDVQQSIKTGEAIKAAVACFLRFGSDVA